ncbi:MAG: M12 family metallo-peptidase [Phycisphaerae bacterium]|nr:M12 family metallo-peptidase [Phycisphaerae bacterium]
MSKVNLKMFVMAFLMFVFVISPSIGLALTDSNDINHITIYIGDAPPRVISEERETVRELFTDVELYKPDLIVAQSEDETDSATVRSRNALVNFDFLKESESIVLNMFHDVSVTALRDRIETRSENCYTWFGQVPGRGLSSVILTVEDGDMAGFISIDEMVYQVKPLGNEIHVLSELCPCDFPPNEPNDVIVPPDFYTDSNTVAKIQQDAVQAIWFDDGSTIDVMVVYTDDVASASGNIGAEIQSAVDQTNQTYKNSGIYQRLRLVHIAEVSYAESDDAPTNLDWVTYNNEINAWRDEYRADLVSFWIERGMNCSWLGCWAGETRGMAWGPWDQKGGPTSSSHAFSIVRRNSATSDYVFAHELGHNMGAGHDVHAPNHSGAFPYSHGYTWDGWTAIHYGLRSIMAYRDWCDNNFVLSCPRKGYWSSPYIYFEICEWPFDWPCTGSKPFGYADTADNHRTLNETAYEVANFRQSNLPPACDINGPYFAECSGATTAAILDGTGSSDPDDDLLTYAWSSDCPDAFFDDSTSPMPTLMVNTSNGCSLICNVILTVTDEVGLSDTCETTFTVQDTIPPDFELSVDPVALWPPNNKMVKITPTWTESDICDPEPEVSLVQITMNESGNGNQDMQVTEDGSIYLRASRSGKSKHEGRIYTITFQACDCSGNCTIQSATVTVPHDRRRK